MLPSFLNSSQRATCPWPPAGAANPDDSITPSGALIKAVMLGGAATITGFEADTGLPLDPPPSFRQGFGRVFTGEQRRERRAPVLRVCWACSSAWHARSCACSESSQRTVRYSVHAWPRLQATRSSLPTEPALLRYSCSTPCPSTRVSRAGLCWPGSFREVHLAGWADGLCTTLRCRRSHFSPMSARFCGATTALALVYR